MEYAALVSGGVDSAVALHSVVERADGQVKAYYLKIWLEDELSFLGSCPWEEDLSYARDVCEAAGVPLEVIPLQQAYYDRVVGYTVSELKAGRTPSPDIFCNQRIKFGAFLDAIDGRADRIVTGHYANVLRSERGVRLGQAPDPVKDQTYFLSQLSAQQIERAEFPLGKLTKAQVRQRAADLALSNKDRPDSQGICFLGKIKYRDFVRHYLGSRRGAIVDRETGDILGQHEGAWFYTIGQRQGLGLGNGPWYVVGRDLVANVIEVAHTERAAAEARSTFAVDPIHWIAEPAEDELRSGLSLKLRHGPDQIPCQLDTSGAFPTVQMERSDRGVAAGQFAVFYNNGVCLGSAMIRPEAAA